MAGTREGGLKAARTLRAKSPNYYAKLGAKGGSAEVTKGFGKNKPLARLAGSIGGKTSRPRVKRRRIKVEFR